MKITNYVNAEKRTCVTVLSDISDDVVKALHRRLKSSQDIIFRGHRSYLPDTIRGIAKCAPDDEFDAEIGTAIAEARALKTYESLYNLELRQLIERLTRDIFSVQLCGENMDPSLFYPK